MASTDKKVSQSNSDVMVITTDEAASSHVDDLLKRHASLRGEQGISRDRSRRWYYQNWFVFMIAGCAAALVAYALIDPYFDDLTYIQGTVKSLEMTPSRSINYSYNGKNVTLSPDDYVEADIGGRNVAFTGHARWRGTNGKYAPIDLANLAEGKKLGVYVEVIPGEEGPGQSIAEFAEENPKPRSGADLSFEELRHRKFLASLLMFPSIAAMIGLFIGAADGIMCRLFRRILLAGAVGLVFGFVGGFISGNVLAEIIYAPITKYAQEHAGTLGFSLQTSGRGLAWALAGMSMGLGQGIALRSKRLILYGFLGGMIGGLLGGLLFDPIDMLLLGTDKPSASVSRWIGFAVIGATVGLMIGIVERLARDAWLRMVEGPLAGKEFLVFKDVMRMGASPNSEIYLFNDPAVAASHAIIRATGDIYEIENTCRENPVCLNGRPVQRSRLRHGDRISLGRTSFVFQRQRAD